MPRIFYVFLCVLLGLFQPVIAKELSAHSSQELRSLYDELYEKADVAASLSDTVSSDIIKLVNNTKYAIVIWDSRVEKDKAYFKAMLSVKIPSSNERLMFYAEDISFSNEAGIVGTVKLKLADDVTIKKGDQALLTFKKDATFAQINCKGFEKMGLSMDLELSKKLVLKEKADGSIDDQNRVKTSFAIELSDFSDFLLEINLPTFQINGLKDFSFTVSKAFLDYSDYANPPAMKLDSKYDPIFAVDSLSKLWQGIYISSFKVKLPKFIKNDDKKGQRLELAANNFVIDDKGITGAVEANNLLSLDKGNLGNWSFSLDGLGVELYKNNIIKGSFKGKIRFPIAKDKDTVGYACTIGMNNTYSFEVKYLSKMSFPMLKADTVKLSSNSKLKIEVMGDTVKIRANLSGTLCINAPLTSDEKSATKFRIRNIKFEELEIANYAPKLKLKGIEYTTNDTTRNPELAKFQIVITRLALSATAKKVTFGVELRVNLNEKFGATGGLEMTANINQDKDGKDKYEFANLTLTKFGLEKVEITKFTLEGSIDFFREDTTFGTGFKGEISMTLELKNKIEMKVGAIFGKIRQTRYWNVDASLEGIKLPIFTGVNLTGFAGGAYQRMKKVTSSSSDLAKSISGQFYEPDSTAGLGFKAGVFLAIPDEKAFSGKLMFEIAFNAQGGLRKIFFLGEGTCMGNMKVMDGPAKLMGKINDFEKSANLSASGIENDIPIMKHFNGMDKSGMAKTFGGDGDKPRDEIKLSLTVEFNFEQKELTANFKPYISVGNGMIKGAYDDNLAGEGNLYIGPDKWFINVGTPSNPIKITALGLAELTSYFMMGTSIEGSPAPPDQVAQILGISPESLDYMRDLNALGDGKGIAFGAALAIETGDKQFLIFYYRITAGLGFDVMVKNYGTDAYCEGRTGSLGVNGWYANGQAYAYFQGSVGINVKLAFVRGRYEILKVSAAAILQAQLPNPFWMKGIVGGNYSILNGLVTGSCRLEVELGEKCQIRENGDELAGIDVIADMSPATGKVDVSVFTKPQGVFNIPLDKEFTIEDEADASRTKVFRAVLKEFSIMDGSTVLLGENEWNKDHTTVAFAAHDILPPNKKLKASLKVIFEAKQNGAWAPYKNDKGKIEEEAKEIEFTTGEAPDYIPLENVKYSYPVIKQKNLFVAQSNKGYVQLKFGQPYLFDAAKYKQQVRLIKHDGDTLYTATAYQVGAKRIDFAMPQGLVKNQVYEFAFVNTPIDDNLRIDKNIKTNEKAVLNSGTDSQNTASLQTKSAEGELLNIEDKVLLNFGFRTSAYDNLAAKMAAVQIKKSYYMNVGLASANWTTEFNQPQEAFDKAELEGYDEETPLWVNNFNVTSMDWFANYMKPLVYKNYPRAGLFTVDRDTAEYGYIPGRNVSFTQTLPVDQLSTSEFSSGTVSSVMVGMKIIGNFHLTMLDDFQQLRDKAAKHFAQMGAKSSAATQDYENILTKGFPMFSTVRNATYPVDMYYRMPGSKQLTKCYTYNIVFK